MSKRARQRVDMPLHDALKKEARKLIPNEEKIKNTRVSDLDAYFIDVFDKHHPGENYLETFGDWEDEEP